MKRPNLQLSSVFLLSALLAALAQPVYASQQQTPSADKTQQNRARVSQPATFHPSVQIVVKPLRIITRTPDDAKELGAAASAVSQRLSETAKDSRTLAGQEIESMGTMTVQGHKLKPVCILSFLKLALHNHYTRDPTQAGEMICRYVHLLSSRARTYLQCELNGDKTERFRAQTASGHAIKYSTIKLEQKLPIVDPGKLDAAMAAIPAGATEQCTLQ
jgi:hypothetical protein